MRISSEPSILLNKLDNVKPILDVRFDFCFCFFFTHNHSVLFQIVF
jgi:hypothetical protein